MEKKCQIIFKKHCPGMKGNALEKCSMDVLKKTTLAKNSIGRGEFSEVWLINGAVIKRNADSSIYQRNLTDRKMLLKRSKDMMKSEHEAYQLLKGLPVMPKFMCEYTDKNGRYYLVREAGDIPLKKGQEQVFLPKWKKGAVSRKEYDKFSASMYKIAAEHGYFYDLLQPAMRKDGSLFITDLGQFISGGTKFIDDEIVKTTPIGSSAENMASNHYWRVNNYDETRNKMDKLDDQIGMKHRVPRHIFIDATSYWLNEYVKSRKKLMKQNPDMKKEKAMKLAWMRKGKMADTWGKYETFREEILWA